MLVVVVVFRVERLIFDLDVGHRVDEGEIEPRLELWMSLVGLRTKEMEEKGQLGCSAPPCHVLSLLSLRYPWK